MRGNERGKKGEGRFRIGRMRKGATRTLFHSLHGGRKEGWRRLMGETTGIEALEIGRPRERD